jgi:hypothetical protein
MICISLAITRGHGARTTISSPKMVEGLVAVVASDISCGGTHTAVIAAPTGEATYVRIPSRAAAPSSSSSFSSSPQTNSSTPSPSERWLQREEVRHLICGDLYTFGLPKAGQLGIPSTTTRQCIATPMKVSFFPENGYRVAKVSCGMHHTVILAVPVHALRVFMTHVFTCGWGEHGRLGHGNEDTKAIPTMVEFPTPFHALEISAGEQHTVVAGAADAYSFGNNSFGQLGVGNPLNRDMQFVASPMKIPLPEGMTLSNIVAGGRHTAAITSCRKFLSWGWNEEGQLGQGSEKDCYLARPCKIPTRIKNFPCSISAVALGLCHTLAVFKNDDYKEFVPPPSPEDEPVVLVQHALEEHPLPTSPITLPPVVLEKSISDELVKPVAEEVEPEPELEPEPEPDDVDDDEYMYDVINEYYVLVPLFLTYITYRCRCAPVTPIRGIM